MLGLKSGVARKLCDIQPKAHATHCHAHSLSLCVKDTTQRCKALSDAMDIGSEIVALVKYSPKRENLLGDIKDNIEQDFDKASGGLTKLSATRWTVRASCFQRILDNYNALMELWKESLSRKTDPDIKARIIGCEYQMTTFNFFFGVNLGLKIFCHSHNLSKTLQGTKMSAVSSKRVANLTKITLQNMRNDQCFELFYSSILVKAKQHSFIGELSLLRKRRSPTRFEEGTGPPFFQDTAQDHYRRVYFEAIDLIVESINLRFTQPSFKAYEELECLILNALQSKDLEDGLQFLKLNYRGDVDVTALRSQLCLLPAVFKDALGNIFCFDDFLNELKELPNEERQLKELPNEECQLIRHVVTISKLLHVNPATSASGERSFSMARRLKTWLRSKMTQERFNSLAILHSHKCKTDTLNLLDIGNQFVSNENRHRNFGKFVREDIL